VVSKKLRVGVIFGGRSGEHEISLMSARSILDALDPARYEPVLIGIDRAGRWHLDEAGRALLPGPGKPLVLDAAAPEVALAPAPGDPGGAAGQLVAAGVAAGAGHRAAVDVFFPVLHGTYGEDGTIQGLLEMAGVPYVGSGVLGSAVGMDKDVCKRLLRDAGVPVVDYLLVRARQFAVGGAADILARVGSELGYPAFVKPANLGSSVGVHKVRDVRELAAAVADALRYDDKALIERAIDAREIECAVLGNEAAQASVPGEIVPSHEFYSYEAKYLDEHGAALHIPAALDEATSRLVQELSVRAFAALELEGMARVDFLLDRGSGAVFVNEVNTIPGFTRISMYPKLWEASGVSYRELVDRLIALAFERHRRRQGLRTSR
jgi:D-alanine-D-alanine ligase